MTIHTLTLSDHERDAVTLLIAAIEAQPDHDATELKTSARILRQYLGAPSYRLFSLAKIAFDDIEPGVKEAIRGSAIQLAYLNAAAQRTQSSLKTITSKLSGGRKKSRHATPFLAALQRG
ncbi:MAG: hypothetical protein WCO00_02695 [Rhodospirillaceae bacterium]